VGGQDDCGFPTPIPTTCKCQARVLECSGLNSTSELKNLVSPSIHSLHIHSSHLQCLNLHDFAGLENLKELKVSSSELEKLCHQEHHKVRHSKSRRLLHHLEKLDLSNNRLHKFEKKLKFGALLYLNLSHNHLTTLPSAFPVHLEILDVGNNRLSENVDKDTFLSLPPSIQFINIAGNPWLCSPQLSWMYPWSLTLPQSARMSLMEAKCRIQEKASTLILVMETYHRQVVPKCPDVCSCDLYYFGTSTLAEPVYTLFVNCSGKELTEFPAVPLHTTILDLSHNKLTDASFGQLDVERDNYLDISGLTLSNNLITFLDNKLLKMKLHRFLKVDRNRLAEVPYDISLMVQRHYAEIFLGGNPWVCTCNSEINNMNLWDKLADLNEVTCSDHSEPQSIVGDRIDDVDPHVLCPPSDEGARRELVLQLVCCLLGICIVLVLSKLLYDYWQYKNKGKLPWIVLKMP